MITRRAFIGTLAGGFHATPLTSHAQPAGKVHRIGVLATGGSSASAMEPFEQGLAP